MLMFKALPKRWIKVVATVWADLQENPAFLTRCVAMPVDDAKHLAHDGRAAREQEMQGIRNARKDGSFRIKRYL
jgi:hypothetical protein